MARLDPSARVRNHAAGILAAGPIRFEALLDELLGRGLDLGPYADERLDEVLEGMERVNLLEVERPGDPTDPNPAGGPIEFVFDRLALIDGTTWTVPISEADLTSETLSVNELGLLLISLINEWCTLEGAHAEGSHTDGENAVDFDFEGRRRAALEALGSAPDGGVALPPGWLAATGVRAGGFLQLRLDGDVVRGSATESAPEASPGVCAALADAVRSRADRRPGGSAIALDALTEAFLTNPVLRGAVLPPLSEWIETAGLVRRGRLIAPLGFDFEAERIRQSVEDAAAAHSLSDPETRAYADLVIAWETWRSAGDEVDRGAMERAASALESISVATAFVEENCDADVTEEMVSFGEALVEAVRGRHRASPAWLVAQALSVAGRTDRFEEWIEVALGFDDEHPLALYDKAWFEFDRGEARRAKALLTRLGMDSSFHDVAILDAALPSSRPAVGRNDPCPCGSGRKYKRCHLGLEEVPLVDRLTWLYRKANWWLERRHRAEVEMMAFLRAGGSGMSPGDLIESDPLIADAVLAEGGRFAEWLDERGSLLPSDEALLAAQWALVERSVFEVTDVRPDEAMTVRDVRTGDVTEVEERLGTHGMRPRTYILARPLPTGADTHQFFGGITLVPDAMLEQFIEVLDDSPGPGEIVMLVADAEAPPTLLNRDRHATVFCETTWQVPDPDAARVALDDTFEPSEQAETWTWLDGMDGTEDDGRDGDHPGGHSEVGRTVLGTLTMSGDRLTVSTNSVERSEGAARIIEDLLGDALLVEELRSDLDDLRSDEAYERFLAGEDGTSGEDGEMPHGMIDPTQAPPEIRAALREQMDRYEEQWVDESIPALGGLTPRQALDDPTRREDLFRLLDHLDDQDSRLPPGQVELGMRTSRLRELLGLRGGPPGEQP